MIWRFQNDFMFHKSSENYFVNFDLTHKQNFLHLEKIFEKVRGGVLAEGGVLAGE